MIRQATQERRSTGSHGGTSRIEPLVPGTRSAPPEPSYYGIPILKPPVWESAVGIYFFLGGLSGGAYVLARLAERFGGDGHRELSRAGTTVALLASLPCAPLLIEDLGDPSRFHHMLRVFKPESPMNLGAWTLTAYSGVAGLAMLREWLRGARTDEQRSRAGKVTDAVVLTITDGAGIPLALLLAGYTGVLLSSTATPIWAKNPWLGPLFSASAINTGAEAIELALRCFAPRAEPSAERLSQIDSLAHAAEIATLAGFFVSAGDRAGALLQGKAAPYWWAGIGGMAAAEALKLLPVQKSSRRWRSILTAGIGIVGGLALRMAFLHAGRPSANDPYATM